MRLRLFSAVFLPLCIAFRISRFGFRLHLHWHTSTSCRILRFSFARDFHVRIMLSISLLIALLTFGGCVSSISSPTAEVKSISLVDQSAQGAKVQVVVELKNDNTVPLPLVECGYSVTLDGIGTFSFVDKPNKAIPARRADINAGPASQMITLIAVFATAGSEVKGAACRVSGSVVYEPPGEVRKVMTESSVPLPRVSFSGEGKIE